MIKHQIFCNAFIVDLTQHKNPGRLTEPKNQVIIGIVAFDILKWQQYLINIWYIDKTAQKNADDYLSFYPTAINLSILDFKSLFRVSLLVVLYSINLSILDFKFLMKVLQRLLQMPINLSILDFKKWNFAGWWLSNGTINLSILDFKKDCTKCSRLIVCSINLSILDFKYWYRHYGHIYWNL